MRAPRISLLTICLFAVSCAGPSTEGKATTPEAQGSTTGARQVRVAIVGTMTGNGAWRGAPAKTGLAIARALLHERGIDLEASVLDDRGSDRRSTRLVRRAASNNVDAVIFAGPPKALPRAEDALASTGTAAFLLYGDLHTTDSLSRHVFQIGPAFRWEAHELAERAVKGGGRLGALTEDSLMGATARRVLRRALEERGAVLASSEVFSPSRLDRIAQHLRTLRRDEVKHLFVEASPGEFGAINRALREMTWSPRLFSFDLTLPPPRRGPHARPGSIASDVLERGAHLEYVESFADYRQTGENTVGYVPPGWEYRAFASAMLSAAVADAEDRALALEDLRDEPHSGFEASFSRSDHLVSERADVGLWERVRPGSRTAERFGAPRDLPWVPLLGTFD